MEPASRPSSDSDARAIGRYLLYGQIAAGGMATVHLARQRGAVGFARTVAVKRLRPQFAEDPDFVAMFLDEARLAARIHHPNVVTTLDVVATGGEVFLVMEYVQGESLSKLVRAAVEKEQRIDPRFVATILASVLHGLHAAHEAVSEDGKPLNIVHRDVSPQNILVGVDGVARVLDFGVAKAAIRTQATRDGQLKGKLSYMSPEQILGEEVTRQADIYSASVVLWEALTTRRAFQFDNEGALMSAVLKGMEDRPSKFAEGLAPAFDTVTMRGLERTAANRFPNARDMALELERCVGIASPSEIGAWVTSLAGPALAERSQLVTEIERSSASRAPLDPSTAGDSEVTQGTPVSKPRVSRQILTATTQDVESSVTFKPTQETRRPPGPRRSMLIPGLVGGAVVVMGLVALRTLMHGPTSSAGPAPSAAVVAPPSATAPVVSREPAVDGGVSTAAPPTGAVTSPAPPSTTAPPDDSRPQVKRGPGAPTRPAPPAPAPKAAAPADCNPPYYFDDQGHKHYKDACFR